MSITNFLSQKDDLDGLSGRTFSMYENVAGVV